MDYIREQMMEEYGFDLHDLDDSLEKNPID